MSLQIPPAHAQLLKRWLELPSEQVAKFLEALERVGPQFNAVDLAKSLIPLTDISPELVLGIADVLITVYRTGEPAKPFEAFLDQKVFHALSRAKVFSDGSEIQEWQKLRSFMLHALMLENTLGTTAKAGEVLTEHERIFDGAKIITDFRPIFHVDVSEAPEAGLVIHMLKITYRDKQKRKFDEYYALDSMDVVKIKNTIDRAIEKEKTLRKTMQDAGLAVLDVQPFY